MAAIRPATVTEVFEFGEGLFREHWEEIALSKHLMVLNPSRERYLMMEAAGQILILAAWENDVMVGYSATFIERAMHYDDLLMAVNDVIFVRRDLRKTKAGLDLIAATESAAKERGARMMLWHAKQNTALAELMPRLGYGVQDVIFSKEI